MIHILIVSILFYLTACSKQSTFLGGKSFGSSDSNKVKKEETTSSESADVESFVVIESSDGPTLGTSVQVSKADADEGVKVSIKEGNNIDSITKDNLEQDFEAAGPPVEISIETNGDLKQPLVISLPLPDESVSLAMQLGFWHYGIAYLIESEDSSEWTIGIIGSDEIDFSESRVWFQSKKSGTFMLVRSPNKLIPEEYRDLATNFVDKSATSESSNAVTEVNENSVIDNPSSQETVPTPRTIDITITYDQVSRTGIDTICLEKLWINELEVTDPLVNSVCVNPDVMQGSNVSIDIFWKEGECNSIDFDFKLFDSAVPDSEVFYTTRSVDQNNLEMFFFQARSS